MQKNLYVGEEEGGLDPLPPPPKKYLNKKKFLRTAIILSSDVF
jgi:hypothetical protein